MQVVIDLELRCRPYILHESHGLYIQTVFTEHDFNSPNRVQNDDI